MRVLQNDLRLRITAILCAGIMLVNPAAAYAQEGANPQPKETPPQDAPLSAAALDSLVAPIALHPDELLAQVLAAATYPLEIVEASRWLKDNGSLKGKALVDAAAKQDWEPCIQALVLFPSILDQLDTNLKWTTALGNAFLAQQEDVMLAVQRQRQKAYAAGALQSNANQQVQVQEVQATKVIVIQPANPEVIYVPTYNPTVVYGVAPAYYPYPAMVYPSYSAGAIVATSAISFGAGIAVGAALGGWHGGGWGWGCNWGPRPALYVNNTFINRYGFRGPAYAGHYGTGAWSHNSYYRRAVPYSNAAVANRYGAGRAVATPYGGAAGVRTPNGAAGVVSGPNRGAAAASTPGGSAAAGPGPNGAAAGAVNPRGQASRSAQPGNGGALLPRGANTNPRGDAFAGGDASRARQNSIRGNGSMGRPSGGGRRR